MRASTGRFILCCVFLVHVLITRNVVAQSVAVEAGEKNINLVYADAGFHDDAPALSLDGQLLYTKQNNHQDLFASIGFAAFAAVTSDIEFGAGVRTIVTDPLDYFLSAVAVGAELLYQPVTAPAFKFETSLYYAGEMLTFSDGENVALLRVNIDYEIASHTSIRLGYRRIKAELNKDITTDFDRGAYLGLSWVYK